MDTAPRRSVSVINMSIDDDDDDDDDDMYNQQVIARCLKSVNTHHIRRVGLHSGQRHWFSRYLTLWRSVE